MGSCVSRPLPPPSGPHTATPQEMDAFCIPFRGNVYEWRSRVMDFLSDNVWLDQHQAIRLFKYLPLRLADPGPYSTTLVKEVTDVILDRVHVYDYGAFLGALTRLDGGLKPGWLYQYYRKHWDHLVDAEICQMQADCAARQFGQSQFVAMSTRLATLTIPQLYRVCAALWPYSRTMVKDLITRKRGYVKCQEGDFDNFLDLFWPMLPPSGEVWLFDPFVEEALKQKVFDICNQRDEAKRELPYRLSIVEEARRALRKEAKERERKKREEEQLAIGAAMPVYEMPIFDPIEPKA